MMSANTQQRIEEMIKSDDVVLFMKGDRRMPQCGFSAAVVEILSQLIPSFTTINVLKDPDLRDGIKTYSQWPTIPQLYIRGEFIGGSDIVRELYASGELQQKLGVQEEAVATPHIELTESAAAAIREALQQSEGEGMLRLEVSAAFEHALTLGNKNPGDIEIVQHGITLVLDKASAKRANGVRIDFLESSSAAGFKIDNPNAPQIKIMTPSEVHSKLKAGEPLELFDVRGLDEWQTAHIEGAVLLDEISKAKIDNLNKDTTIVFHCHRGGRSRKAAEHYAALGYTNVYNMEGGIERWSLEVDPSVPRY
jgi:monothiol glutaredoxin